MSLNNNEENHFTIWSIWSVGFIVPCDSLSNLTGCTKVIDE